MFAFRNAPVCSALVSTLIFSLAGCCCSGKCGLPFCKKNISQETNSQPCSTCGDETGYSAPTQSFTTPTLGYETGAKSYSTQEFSTEQFSSPVQTANAAATIIPRATAPRVITPRIVPEVVEPSADGGGFIPKVRSSSSQ